MNTREEWQAYADVHGHDFWHVKESKFGIGIALVHAYPEGSPLASTVEERARLIAAAPKMLEACQAAGKGIVEILEQVLGGSPVTDLKPITLRLTALLDAAINEASP